MTNNEEIERIAAVVARTFATNVEALKGRSRGSSRKYLVVAARQMLYYYLRTHTVFSLPEISEALQCFHATVVRGAAMAKKRLEAEESFRSDLERIERALGYGGVKSDAKGEKSVEQCERGQVAKVPESEDKHWECVQRFLQEVGLVLEYLHDRVATKRNSIKLVPLFGQAADADGDLTDELIVKQLEAIARQAAAGFVAGDGFPIFGPLS